MTSAAADKSQDSHSSKGTKTEGVAVTGFSSEAAEQDDDEVAELLDRAEGGREVLEGDQAVKNSGTDEEDGTAHSNTVSQCSFCSWFTVIFSL